MSTSVLISYTTRSGSTKEVAEAIAATLRDAGLWPDLLPMSQTMSLRGQSSVILGAPLYMGRLPKEFPRVCSPSSVEALTVHQSCGSFCP